MTQKSNSVVSIAQQHIEKEEEMNKCEATHSLEFGNQPTERIMMCQRTFAFNPQNSEFKQPVTVFLDCGSHRTFVSDRLAASLGLESLRTERFKLGVFGDNTSHSCESKLVRVGLTTKDGDTLFIEANQMSQLVGELTTYCIEDKDQASLQAHKLKIPSTKPVPDLLIGIDQFWQLQPKINQQLPSGFTLVSTKLGTHLCGRGLVQSDATHVILQKTLAISPITEDITDDSELSHVVKRYFMSDLNQYPQTENHKRKSMTKS